MPEDRPRRLRRPPRPPSPQVWFWDGVREYRGRAMRVTPEKLEAHLKISQFGSTTIVPTPDVIDGLILHLTGRKVDFRIRTGELEARSKGLVTAIGRDKDNERRLELRALFTDPSARDRRILERFASP